MTNPTITPTWPKDGSTDVAPFSGVEFEIRTFPNYTAFNSGVCTVSITGGIYSGAVLYSSGAWNPVYVASGHGSFVPSSSSYFDLITDFALATTYYVNIIVEDVLGGHTELSYSFTTAASVGRRVDTTPTNGATGVACNTTVLVDLIDTDTGLLGGVQLQSLTISGGSYTGTVVVYNTSYPNFKTGFTGAETSGFYQTRPRQYGGVPMQEIGYTIDLGGLLQPLEWESLAT